MARRATDRLRGCETLVVERYGFLGGMGTAAGVTNFCGLHANDRGEIRQVVHGVAATCLPGDAVLAAHAGVPFERSPRAIDVRELQQQLESDGAYLGRAT